MVRRAFTLLELLVTVGIIALLLAVALPAIHAAQAHARDAGCRSNLRQLFQAQQAYAVDYGRFAALWTEAEPLSWRARLDNAAPGTAGAMVCPDASDAPGVDTSDLAGLGVDTPSYAINGAMQFPEWRFRPDRVPNPAYIIAIAEQPSVPLETAITSDGFGVWGAHGLASWFRSEHHNPASGYRHPGETGGNVAMMDGAVTRLTHTQLRRESGHWYWFDALAMDTAFPPADGSDQPEASMPTTFTPNPSPSGPGGPFDQPPAGPFHAPCGCPV